MTTTDWACIAFVLTFLAVPSVVLAVCVTISVVREARVVHSKELT